MPTNTNMNADNGTLSLDPNSPEFHKAFALKLATQIVTKMPDWTLQLNNNGGYALYIATRGLAMWIYPSADDEFKREFESITDEASKVLNYKTREGFNFIMVTLGNKLFNSIMNYFYREKWIRHIRHVSVRIPNAFQDEGFEQKIRASINILEKNEIAKEEAEKEAMS